MLAAERAALAHLRQAAKRAELKPPKWCTAMLAPGGALAKLCAPLKTFTSLANPAGCRPRSATSSRRSWCRSRSAAATSATRSRCTGVHASPARARASRAARNALTQSLDPRVTRRAAQIEVDIPEDDYLKKRSYSSYKKYHTLKFLIAILPCGRLAFVSDGYPGSFSDDESVRVYGFLDLLDPLCRAWP